MKAILYVMQQYCYFYSYFYNHSTKSGSNQTAFMPKLGDEQLTSNVSMIKIMV